jgi:NagD protein
MATVMRMTQQHISKIPIRSQNESVGIAGPTPTAAGIHRRAAGGIELSPSVRIVALWRDPSSAVVAQGEAGFGDQRYSVCSSDLVKAACDWDILGDRLARGRVCLAGIRQEWSSTAMEARTVKNYLIDMDGVLVSGSQPIPGAREFLEKLLAAQYEYLVLTNNSTYTQRDLSHRLHTMGLEIPEDRIFTSAMATARFLDTQRKGGKAFVIGESGLTDAVYSIGFVITDIAPDYVVLGETNSYDMVTITKAVRLVAEGARFIATNPDPSGPSESGLVPATGALAALIERATGKSPLYVGKPNPFMMRAALNYLGVHSEETAIIGDRMETDIIAGVESGLHTILVLTGVTRREEVDRFAYQPSEVVETLLELPIEP